MFNHFDTQIKLMRESLAELQNKNSHGNMRGNVSKIVTKTYLNN